LYNSLAFAHQGLSHETTARTHHMHVAFIQLARIGPSLDMVDYRMRLAWARIIFC